MMLETPFPPDRYLTCQHCGITFVWTGWEQQHDAAEPHLCPGCRHVLRLARRWGVVKWFDPRRGFGFITMADGTEIYVRRRDIRKGRPRRGDLVRFRVVQGKHGPRAVDVRVARPREGGGRPPRAGLARTPQNA